MQNWYPSIYLIFNNHATKLHFTELKEAMFSCKAAFVNIGAVVKWGCIYSCIYLQQWLYIDRMLWSRMQLQVKKETISSPYQEFSAGIQLIFRGISSPKPPSKIFRGITSPPRPLTSYLLNSIKYRFCSNTPRSFNWTWYLQEHMDFFLWRRSLKVLSPCHPSLKVVARLSSHFWVEHVPETQRC